MSNFKFNQSIIHFVCLLLSEFPLDNINKVMLQLKKNLEFQGKAFNLN